MDNGKTINSERKIGSETRLYRQVHPSWYLEQLVSSQAFTPMKKDCGKLSVDNGDMINPDESFRIHTSKRNLQSIGVLAVTGQECMSLDLPVVPDSVPGRQAHTLIDLSDAALSNTQKKTKARELRAAARKPGWQHTKASQGAVDPSDPA